MSFLPNKIYNRIQQHRAFFYQTLSAYLKCWYFYIKGLVALKLWVPQIVRFERLLTCFIKPRQSLCPRLKINMKVSAHSMVMYSAIILQTERSAGTQRSLSCNQAAITVAEGCRHMCIHTHAHTHTEGEHIFTSACSTFPWCLTLLLEREMVFRECTLFSTKGVYGLRWMAAKNFLKIKLKKDWRIFISISCVWFVKPGKMSIEAVVER